jgi:hypothetical protein
VAEMTRLPSDVEVRSLRDRGELVCQCLNPHPDSDGSGGCVRCGRLIWHPSAYQIVDGARFRRPSRPEVTARPSPFGEVTPAGTTVTRCGMVGCIAPATRHVYSNRGGGTSTRTPVCTSHDPRRPTP